SSLPDFLHAPFASAMGQSLYLPAGVLAIGFVAVLFLAKPKPIDRSTESVPTVTKQKDAVGAADDSEMGRSQMRRSSIARVTARVREDTSSLSKRCSKCVLTVASPI